MIDLLKDKLKNVLSRQERINLLREYLQILILKCLSDRGAFSSIAFIGGTALRVLHRVRRYSEDLDFSVHEAKNYRFEKYTSGLKRELSLQNINVEIKVKTGKVDTCSIRFLDLLNDLGLAVSKNQKLLIKVEIDTNPPRGALIERQIVNIEQFIFPVSTHDLSSLMAGKLHCIICRKYAKGRDFFDLLWYLSKKVQPNTALLENAIHQTEDTKVKLSGTNWIDILKGALEKTNFDQVVKDVTPFIEDENTLKMLNKGDFINLLESYE